MTTEPDTDDNKDNTWDEKEGMNINKISNLQLNDTNHNKSKSPSIRKKRKRKHSKSNNNINSVLKQIPMKRVQKKQQLPSLTSLCLEIILQNLSKYDSFDFMPQDLACELLLMVIDRQAMNRDTARPFLNTKHELIKQFCKKHIRLSRLPPRYNYGCRGFDC